MDNKVIIELSPWEVERINTGLKTVIDTFLRSPANVRDASPDERKAVSYLVAFRAKVKDAESAEVFKTVRSI